MDENKKEEPIEVEKVGEIEQSKKDEKQEEVKENSKNTKNNKKAMCITALILGIVSLVFFCLWYVSIPCGILAIIFGIMGIKSEDKPMAITGLVTGAIGLIVSILLIFIIIVGVAAGISSMNTGNKDIFKNNIITDKYDFDIYD